MVFLTGATGYMGRRLAAELVRRGHEVTALARHGSQAKLHSGCVVAIGDALSATSYRERVPKGCTFVHLVGVAHSIPAKTAEFQGSAWCRSAPPWRLAVSSCRLTLPCGRKEKLLSGQPDLNATILRPWYVPGPGHWWPMRRI